MSAAQALRQQVGNHLVQYPEDPARAEGAGAKQQLHEAVAQRLFARRLGQIVGHQATLNRRSKAQHFGDLSLAGCAFCQRLSLCKPCIDQLRHGPVVGLLRKLPAQQPEVRRLEIL